MNRNKHTGYARIMALVFAVAIIPLACAGGSAEGAAADEEGEQPVARTVVANPEEMQQAFMAVADEVLPSVVEVNVLQIVEQRPQSLFEYFFGNPEQGQGEQRRPGLGSGVIVRTNDGTVYVVTNYHVVQNADEIGVVLHDGREFEASLVGGDQRTDLAMLEFSSSDDIPVIDLGDSDDVRVGQWALAIGNPYGFESSMTAGIISAVGRTAQPGTPIGGFTEYIQTDAAINPGNSGGALVDLDGRLIGINSWIASQSGSSAGIGFAIPTNVVKGAIGDFIEHGRIIYGWLGVTVIDPTSQRLPGLAADLGVEGESGVLIDNLHQASPASDAGVLPGDFVTEVDGSAVENAVGFARSVGGNSPGTEVSFTVIRSGDEQTLSVTLDEQPEPEELNNPANFWPGMNIIPITDEIRNQSEIPGSLEGVIAIRVIGGSPVAGAGIRRGDVITAINGTDTHGAQEFYDALNAASGRVEFSINRGGREIGISLRK